MVTQAKFDTIAKSDGNLCSLGLLDCDRGAKSLEDVDAEYEVALPFRAGTVKISPVRWMSWRPAMESKLAVGISYFLISIYGITLQNQ